jgi:DNA repair photolyase
VISRHISPDVGFAQSINPYRGCAHGCPYCLSGDTLVLMGDGRARAIAELKVGDEIYGTKLVGNERRYVKSRVLAHWSTIKPAHRITLGDGTVLVSSGDHRFLADDGWRFVTEAGAGEPSRRSLTLSTNLMGPAALAHDLTGHAVLGHAGLRVASIEPLGRAMNLYDITTETEDFIANGVVSHNCFARPTHAYLGLSPGLDFETRLTAKVNAAEKLREELAKPGYKCETLTIGVNTDAYQPIERQQRVTRSIIEVAYETNHPVSFITKSALIERDLDLLAPMAKKNLVAVTLSITTLDHKLSMKMEPRTSAPARRLEAVRRLTEAGIPVNVNVAPVIPFLTDSELEPILEAAAKAGAVSAGYVLIRLPWEVRPIFKEWLEKNFPLKAEHVMSRIRDMREGRENDPNFGTRMVGKGTLAELLSQRFRKAVVRFGLDRDHHELDCSLFVPPSLHGQKTLF